MKKFIFAFILLFLKSNSYSIETFSLSDTADKFNLYNYLYIYEDKTNELKINEIVKMPEEKFIKNTKKMPNFGYSSSSYWIHIPIKSKFSVSEYFLEIQYPLLDKIDFYLVSNGKVKIQKKGGDKYKFYNREIYDKNIIFKIPPLKKNYEIYLKIVTSSSVILPINVYTKNSLVNYKLKEDYLYGIYYGLMIVMLLYNLFLLFMVKDINYLFYTIYILAITFLNFGLNGLSFKYLWPNHISWANMSIPVSIGFVLLTGLIFSKFFLNTSKNIPGYNLLLNFFIVLLSIVFTLSFILDYSIIIRIETVLALIVPLIIFIAGILVLLHGVKSARYFLIAWVVLITGSILLGARNSGLITSNFFTTNAQQIGSGIEVILLSLALGDRYNLMRKEKVAAQHEIIEMQESYTQLLEKTVRERTDELKIERDLLKQRNEIMNNELKLARRIQEQLIPNNFQGDNIFSLYKPMELVGGDFFDFIHFRESSKIGIFISDVSGHGVPAAFITSMLKSIIQMAGIKKEDPAELLFHINDHLENKTDKNFITAFYGIYDFKTRRIHYSNAGHNLPFIVKSKKITQITGHKGIPLAIMGNEEMQGYNKIYKNTEEKLPKNSKLLLCTDGYTEATPVKNQDIDFENSMLNDVLKENAKMAPENFVKNIYNSLLNFRGADYFEDDICLISVDIK